jgi:hypothetical protein
VISEGGFVVGIMLSRQNREGKCNRDAGHDRFNPSRSVRTHAFSRATSIFA